MRACGEFAYRSGTPIARSLFIIIKPYYIYTSRNKKRERERERKERGDKTVKKGRRKMRVRDQHHHHLRGTHEEREKKMMLGVKVFGSYLVGSFVVNERKKEEKST